MNHRIVVISCFGAATLALLIGCGEDAEGEVNDVVAACNELCEVQADGAGCSGEPSSNCLGLCDLYAEKTGACADRTREVLECKQGMTWRCSEGSSQAFSTDSLCEAEEDAVIEACSD